MIGDRILKFMVSWGLLLVSLIAFGLLAAFYFVFFLLAAKLIDAKLVRPVAETELRRAGVAEEEIDSRLLPRDRWLTVARGVAGLALAWAFYRFA